MGDLYIGLAIMMGLTIALGLGTWLATAKASIRTLDIAASIVIVLLVLFVIFLREHILLARLLPFSNLVIVGNWLPPLGGILAGLLVRRIKGRRVSQILWTALLLVTSSVAMLDPFRGHPPKCMNETIDVNCASCVGVRRADDLLHFHRQTSDVTCSPAAACTLLSHHGFDCREEDMAEACLTRRGTTWQGLYRGLKLATAGTEWDVEVFDVEYDAMVQMPGPKILFVELIPNSGYDPVYERKWGWQPGQRHTVVFYRPADEDRVLIGDPSVGVEYWSMQDMETLWHGKGMRLVER